MKAHAYVLISSESRNTNETFGRLMDIPGVKSAYQTTGRWDAILFVECDDWNALPRLVVDKIRNLEGVRHTETLFAFERF